MPLYMFVICAAKSKVAEMGPGAKEHRVQFAEQLEVRVT